MEGVGLSEKAKTDQKSPKKRTVGDKKGQNTKMEASDGRTRELRSSVDRRQPEWEKSMAGGSLTCPHAPPGCRRVVAAAERETCACGCVVYLMLEIFSLVGRLGRCDSKGGVVGNFFRQLR